MTARYRKYIARFISASRLLNDLFLPSVQAPGEQVLNCLGSAEVIPQGLTQAISKALSKPD